VDAAVAEIWGDRDRLLQVFENLIGNAIKFTEAGGRIAVGATASGGEVVFRVADTGCGITSEILPGGSGTTFFFTIPAGSAAQN
jgi:signal transduction histidine kinase